MEKYNYVQVRRFYINFGAGGGIRERESVLTVLWQFMQGAGWLLGACQGLSLGREPGSGSPTPLIDPFNYTILQCPTFIYSFCPLVRQSGPRQKTDGTLSYII